MNEPAPMVSVLMPMRNAAPFVAAALGSVLAERGVPLEVIVIDDGSTDGSAEVVRRLGDARVRLMDGPRQGIAAAFNAGLAAARGAIIMRCDADDAYPPGRLAAQVAWLEAHPDYAAVCGGFVTVDPDGRPLKSLFDPNEAEHDITESLRDGVTHTHLCAYAIRAEVLREVGGCRPWFVTAEDIDLQFRVAQHGPRPRPRGRVMWQPLEAYRYTLHDASITHRQPTPARLFYEQSARAFALQRKQHGRDDLDRGTPPMPPKANDDTTHATTSAAAQAQGMLFSRAWDEHRAGRRGEAIRTGWRAWRIAPHKVEAIKSMVSLLVKPCKTL